MRMRRDEQQRRQQQQQQQPSHDPFELFFQSLNQLNNEQRRPAFRMSVV